MDLSKIPAWLISIALVTFATGFIISVFLLEEERFFMGMSFGAKQQTTPISDKAITDLDKKIEDLNDEINKKLNSNTLDNTVLAIYKTNINGDVRCPDGWGIWAGSEGKFLRGLQSERKLGDTQGFATALPNGKFKIIDSGNHTHKITGTGANGSGGNASQSLRRGNGDKASHPYDDSFGVEVTGDHSHEIQGGDIETRPINLSVLLCVRN